MNYNNITVSQAFGTFEFGRDERNSTRCFLFGVTDSVMYRYTFEVDLETKSVLLAEAIEVPNPHFNGKHYKSIVTQNFFIVSCSDCAVP